MNSLSIPTHPCNDIVEYEYFSNQYHLSSEACKNSKFINIVPWREQPKTAAFMALIRWVCGMGRVCREQCQLVGFHVSTGPDLWDREQALLSNLLVL